MPFSSHFNDLHTAIESAVSRTGLLPRRTDKTPRDPDFIQDIVKQTRAARIVVAVCSPEPDTGQPNPNVMYELGLAHSIGKSTIILTTTIDFLPSDLRSKNVVSYNTGEEKQQSFVDRLRLEILIAMDRVRNKLTDDSYQDILVNKVQHWTLLNSTIWDSFMTVLEFGKQVHHHFQTLDTGHVDHLRSKLEEIFVGHSAPREKLEFQRAWDNYISQYDNVYSEFFNQLPADLRRVSDAFQTLQVQARGDQRTYTILEKSKEFHERIATQLNSYSSRHDNICTNTREGMLRILEDHDKIQQLLIELYELSRITKGLIMQADSLIRNLIQVITERR